MKPQGGDAEARHAVGEAQLAADPCQPRAGEPVQLGQPREEEKPLAVPQVQVCCSRDWHLSQAPAARTGSRAPAGRGSGGSTGGDSAG